MSDTWTTKITKTGAGELRVRGYEITDMIRGIQAGTQQAVASMESGISEVDRGRELTDSAGASLTEIVSRSQHVMDMIQQLATASEEQSVAAEEISQMSELCEDHDANTLLTVARELTEAGVREAFRIIEPQAAGLDQFAVHGHLDD